MGICSSADSTNVATAKLILQDGKLQEFSYPVKVSYLLQSNPTCFICDSDDMDFDDVVSAISGDEVLRPGQLYFALPLSWLRHPLQAEEMAALAVMASSALSKNSGGGGAEKCGCGRKSVTSVKFSAYDLKSSHRVVAGGRRSRTDCGRRRKFAANLDAIPE